VRRCIDLILHDLVAILAEQGETPPNGVDDSPAVLQFLLSHTFFSSLKHTRAVPSANDNFTDTVRTHHPDRSGAQSGPIPRRTSSRGTVRQEVAFLERLLLAPGNEGVASEDLPESLTALGVVGFRSASRVVFAAPLYRNVLIQRLYGSLLCPFYAVRKLYALVRSCVVRLNPEHLQRYLSPSPKDRPLCERHWQMEFYRAATSQLSSLHVVWPDVGALFGCTTGCLDFYVSGLGWGIELLREGDRATQHAAGFEAGGICGVMKANLKEYHPHACSTSQGDNCVRGLTGSALCCVDVDASCQARSH
jgi:hypothetical protein